MAATLVVTGAGFVSYQKVLFPKGNALSDVKTVQKLNYLEELIDTEYLDEKDESSLREGLYAGLLAGLKDPYSTYYTAEQYKELNTSNEGSRKRMAEGQRSCSSMKADRENRQV